MTDVPADQARLEARLGERSDDLRGRAARGTIVNGIFLVGLNGLGLVRGFMVAGFLTTEEYGVWGILIISLGTLLWLKEIGIADKYVQQEEEDQEVAFQKAFTLELIVMGSVFLVMLAVLPLFALVYGETQIIAPGLVLATVVLALGLQLPVQIHYRRLDFVRQRTYQAIDPLLAFVVTVGLAVAGLGTWALVLGTAAGSWAAAIVMLWKSPYPLKFRWDRVTALEYGKFSWPIVVASGSGLLIAQGSVLVGEWEVGLAGIGAFTLASTITQYARRVDDIVTQTVYPIVCAVQDRTDVLQETFLKTNRLALMWGAPFGVALLLFSPDLVDFAIGDKWEDATVVLQMFGLVAALDQFAFNWTAFLRARGDTKPIAVYGVVSLVTFCCVPLPLLLTSGLDWFAAGFLATTLAGLVVRGVALRRLMPGLPLVRHALRAAAPSIPAIGVVLALRAVGPETRDVAQALIELGAYFVVTAIATFLFERALIAEVLGYLKRKAAPTS